MLKALHAKIKSRQWACRRRYLVRTGGWARVPTSTRETQDLLSRLCSRMKKIPYRSSRQQSASKLDTSAKTLPNLFSTRILYLRRSPPSTHLSNDKPKPWIFWTRQFLSLFLSRIPSRMIRPHRLAIFLTFQPSFILTSWTRWRWDLILF